MIQIANFGEHYDNIYDKIHTFLFFWWFILNVLWLIFKNFWSKSIDSGKKELILNSRFGHIKIYIYEELNCKNAYRPYHVLLICNIHFLQFLAIKHT